MGTDEGMNTCIVWLSLIVSSYRVQFRSFRHTGAITMLCQPT